MTQNTMAIMPAFMPEDLEGKKELAEIAIESGILPESIKKSEALIMIWYAAQELGIRPYAAINNLYPINGKVTMSADMMLALVIDRDDFINIETKESGEKGEEFTVTTVVTRKKKKWKKEIQFTGKFSMKDAFRAGLLNKDNWKKYPERMLKHRAQAFALRDAFPDVIFAMSTPDEAMNIIEGDAEVVTEEPVVETIATEEALAVETEERKPPKRRVINRTKAPAPKTEKVAETKPEDEDQSTVEEVIQSKNTVKAAEEILTTAKKITTEEEDPKEEKKDVFNKGEWAKIALNKLSDLKKKHFVSSAKYDEYFGIINASHDFGTDDELKNICSKIGLLFRISVLYVRKAIDAGQASSFKKRLDSTNKKEIGDIALEILDQEAKASINRGI